MNKIKLKNYLLFPFLLLGMLNLQAQTVYLTTGGGSFDGEMWVSITTGANGTGTVVWSQGDGTLGNGAGALNDVAIDVTANCGQTLYLNAYDEYGDSWNGGGTYTLRDAAAGGGTIIINNGGASPDDGVSGTSNWDGPPEDELETSESFSVACLCTVPTATYTVVPDCANSQFSIDVNVAALGNATAVDISNDAGIATTSNVGTGTTSIGPFPAGIDVIVIVDGSNYGGCVATPSTIQTEACACTTNPTAIVVSTNLNCGTTTYDIQVTVTNDGSGDANMTDILIDGAVQQANAATGNLYTFNVATGSHTVLIQAEGASFVTCEATYSTDETCNGSNSFSTAAPNILGTCGSGGLTGDLSVATAGMAQGFTSFCDDGGAGGSTGNNFIRDCSAANFNNNTNWVDVWYQVDLPDGGDELTLQVTGLGAQEIVGYVLYTADPGTDAGSNEASADNNMGCSFFDNTVTSHTITGLADESTAPLYIRILSIAFDDGAGCAAITNPNFSICASAPQANDVCNDGLNINSFDDDVINDPDSFLPVTQSGDISSANIDSETSPAANGTSCGGATMTTSEEDLWYSIKTPATGNYYLELDIDFTGTEDEIYVILETFCSSGTVIGCESISADGTVVFDQNNLTNFDNALTANNDYNVRIVLPTGSNASTFDISAQLVAENNTCDIMQEVFPGFDIDDNTDMNFNFSTDSGSDPVIAGNDLWYQFDPVSATDANGVLLASTTAEVTIGGLDAGEEVTIVLYKGNGLSSNNCTDLAGDYLETLVVTGNGVVELACLDELHTSVSGGYIVRVIQTGGATTIDEGLINVDAQPPGPHNNDCENVWDGSGPTNLGIGDATTNFNPYFLLPGFSNYLSGDFENATDCNPNTASAVCNGVNQEAILSNEDRDLWYVFQVPDNTCAADGLTNSSVVDEMTFLYNAGSAFEDGILYVYSTCGDANLIDCSGVLDGAPSGAGDDQFNDPESTWTATGLTQGEFYLLRIKPHDISSNGVNNEFDFDISMMEGNPKPCNDDPANAEALPVNTCLDYTSLETWSALGASETAPVSGAPESDVWFSFVAPDPANGGTYTTAASWVTVFFESVSGENLTLELYETMTSQAAGTSAESASGAGDQQWSQFGNLTPGQTYYLRLYHKENATTDVTYQIGISTGTGEEPGWTCGENSYSSGAGGCSTPCGDLREQWFKIDLPDGTPGNAYWMIEVFGYDEWLDFELRSKYLNGNTSYDACSGTESATVGTCADFDHPCSSTALEAAVSLDSTTPLAFASDLVGTSAPSSCDDSATSGQAGQGVRKIYFNMNGAVAGAKDYYYLRVFMDPSSPNYATATDINICQLNFSGPYSNSALADAGGTPDLQCLACDITDVNITTDGTCSGSDATFTLDFDVSIGSGNYEIFATADNATYGITTGDVLGTITGGATTGTDLSITGTISNTLTAGTISVDIRDTDDPTNCLGGTPLTINVPACSTCAADVGDINNNATDPAALIACGGILTATFSSDYTAADETDPGAGFEYIFVLVDAAGTILQNSTTGVFDYTSLTAGTYNVYGISYETANPTPAIADYLTTITGDGDVNDIAQIQTDATGTTICVDIDNEAVTGASTSITVTDAIVLTPTASSETCSVDNTTYSYDFTITGGSGTYTTVSSTDGYTITNNGGGSYTVSGIPSGNTTTINVTDDSNCMLSPATQVPASGINCCGASIGTFPGN